jgi:hypothetical protein
MAAPGVYDRFFPSIDGKLLGQADSCSIEYQGSPIPVATFLKDFAGVTPVPKSAKMTIDSFVPQAGYEFDVIKAWLGTKLIKVQARFGGSGITFVASGYADAPSIKSSATDSTKLTFSIMVEASAFT